MVTAFRGLVRASARPGDELCLIAGPGCPYTLPIAGRPLIGHAVKALCDAGAREVLVVVDASIAEAVADVLEPPRDAALHVAIQPDGDEDATERAVEEALGPGPLVRIRGDALFPEVPEVSLPTRADSPFDLDPAWVYDGTLDGVLEANSLALDSLKRARLGVDLTRVSLQGRVQIDPTAELDGAKIRGPVYIGPGAQLVETYVGPYSSIAAGVVLEGVEIEHSLVLEGAQIRYPGRRLEASLIGAGARIGRDYSLPSALRLRVGPGADIQLS